jgi:hypothetical protein
MANRLHESGGLRANQRITERNSRVTDANAENGKELWRISLGGANGG